MQNEASIDKPQPKLEMMKWICMEQNEEGLMWSQDVIKQDVEVSKSFFSDDMAS